MSNRVEELEETVQKLEAAVDGLTEQLVETRERLAELERAGAPEPTPESEPSTETAHAETFENGSGAEESAATADAAEGGDVDEEAAGDEEEPAEPAAVEEEESGASDDEIIVA